MGGSSTGMYNALGYAFMVEMGDLFAQDKIFQ